MDARQPITPAQLPDVLLHVATRRPVFVWGQPGIGKSSLVEQFAQTLGYPCVTLLGSQLAPEDLSGVPRIVESEHGTRSEFCPPVSVARPDPYVLFLDELNGASHEVQRSLYSLILDRRLGDFALHDDTVVIGAGNRASDAAIVRPLPSALINRLVHVHLRASVPDWIAWARAGGIHPWVVEYIELRPDQLTSPVPKTEQVFSTPRSWHALSDVLYSYGEDIDDTRLEVVAHGCVAGEHATGFRAYVRQLRHAWDLESILRGERRWPSEPAQADILYFLADSLRARLAKDLPAQRDAMTARQKELAHRAKAALTQLAEINTEVAQLVAADGEGLPGWFVVELVRDLPRLAARRS